MRNRNWLPRIVFIILLALVIGVAFWSMTVSSIECHKSNGCNKRELEIIDQALGRNTLRFDLQVLKEQLMKDPSVSDVTFVKSFKKIKVDIKTDQKSFIVGVVDVIDQDQSTQSATLTYKLQKIRSLSTQSPSKTYLLFNNGEIVSSGESDINFLVYASKSINQETWKNYGKSFDYLSKIKYDKLVFLDKEGFVWLDSRHIMVFDITKDLQTIWDTLQQIRQASRIEDALLIDMRFKKPTITYLQGQ